MDPLEFQYLVVYLSFHPFILQKYIENFLCIGSYATSHRSANGTYTLALNLKLRGESSKQGTYIIE